MNDTKLVLDKLSAAINATDVLDCVASIQGPWAFLYWQVTIVLVDHKMMCVFHIEINWESMVWQRCIWSKKSFMASSNWH